ncbi:MAG: PAS domain S-box protein, partial [Sedimenticola sp.]|nr:PAS domain S-box protein [Sedimenticola sp.]
MMLMTVWVGRLNRELKRSKLHLELQYELILNSVADGILGVDLAGNTTFANRAMTQITGWTEHDLLGKNQHQLLHHSRADGTPHPSDQCPVYATCRDQIPRFVNDDVFWKRDGKSFPVEYSCTPIRDGQHKTVGSVVVFRDISDRKRIDEEARQHQDDLAHVARLSTMGEMASGIAHEINQPLTAIATNAHACIRMLESNSGETERVIDVMERIGAQAARAGEIIKHLRQFVKKEQPELSLIDINEVINEVITLLRTEIRKTGVRINLKLNADVGAVMAQHIQIDQVILNLARNAIEAMMDVPEGKRSLTIVTENTQEGFVMVSLSDTGTGLAPSVADQLFNPFVTTKSNGMGLGLSISQGIIEAHKGRIFVEPRQTGGTTFVFLLPLHQKRESEK